MKTNMARILCLVLVLVLSVGMFAGCKKDKVTPTDVTGTDVVTSVPEDVIIKVDDSAPYAIAKDANGKDVVILTKDGLTVAENTTLEAFLACVTAKEGYTIKVSDEKGKEVTDKKAVLAKGMIFEVIKKDATDAEVKLNIVVITAAEMQSTIDKQAEINKKPVNSQTAADGKTITLASVWHYDYKAADAIGQTYTKAMNAIKSKNGITTVVNALDPNSATNTIVSEVTAGKASADIFEVNQAMTRNIAKQGAAANIYDSKTLNKSLFKCAATETVTFNGKAYGITYATKSVEPMGVIYNKDLLAKYAKEYDIVKLYDQKKWNFANCQAIAKACTVDTDGNGTYDIHGIISNTNIIGMALTANAGGTALKVNEKVEATMCNEAGIKALQWCKELINDKSWKYIADIDQCASDFASGKAAMFVSYLNHYPKITANAKFSLGFVLMPIGPAQTDYKNGVYDGRFYLVPKTRANRLDDIGTWLNGIASNTSTALLNNKVKDLAKNGFDAKSQEIYKWVVNNMTPEYSTDVFGDELSAIVDNSVVVASKQPQKEMNRIKSQAQAKCDDYYKDIYNLK